MSYMYAGTIRNRWGRAVESAALTAYTDAAGTVTASLEDTDGDPIANPTTTDERGRVEVYSESYRLWYKVTGDDTVMRLVRFCDLQQTDIDGLPWYDVTAYGAEGDGITDDSAAIQAAVDACGASGGVVLFPPGCTYLIDSASVTLPHGNTRNLMLSGYGATLKLGATAASAFSFLSLGDYEHFTIEGFAVDCDNNDDRAGSGLLAGYTVQNNISDINIRDCRIYNVYCDPANPVVNPWRGMQLAIYGEPTGSIYTILNVLVERVRVEGGNSGVNIWGTGAAADVLVTLDDITIRDCYHDTGIVSETFVTCSNFHVGSYGRGGKYLIENCTGIGSGDVGIEVNNGADTTVRDCRLENVGGLGAGYYIANYAYPLGDSATVTNQVVNIIGCTHVKSSGTAYSPAYEVAQSGSTFMPYGTIRILGCSHIRTTDTLNDGARQMYEAILTSVGAEIKTLTIRDFFCSITGWTSVVGGNYVNPILLQQVDCDVTIDGVHYIVDGVNGDAGDMVWRALRLEGTGNSYKISDVSLVGYVESGWSPLVVYGGGGASQSADYVSVSGVRMDCTPSPGGAYPYAIYLDGLTVTHGPFISDCQYKSTAPAAVTTKVTLNIDSVSTHATTPTVTTAAAHGMVAGDWVHIDGITELAAGYYQVLTVPLTTTFTVSGTTTGTDTGTCQPAYTNRDYYDEQFVVTGGTVTAIQLSTNKGTTWTTTGLTAGVFILRHGDSICITNSSAPTTTKIPRP